MYDGRVLRLLSHREITRLFHRSTPTLLVEIKHAYLAIVNIS